MKIFAHRGYRGLFPENTMIAYMEAEKTGCEAIELDCHLTKDGEVVIIHDETLTRTTDMDGVIGYMTLEQVRQANAASLYEGRYRAQRVPTFEEYCQWVASTQLFTNVEIKTDIVPYPGIEEKIWSIVKRYGLEERMLFSSFNHVSLLELQRIAPQARLGALVWEKAGARAFLADYCTQHGFSAWHPSVDVVTKASVDECHSVGVEVNVWTVNDFTTFTRVYEAGCDGVFTDYPEAALVWRERLVSRRCEE
ncbi:MAG: glycerophosphodiester phosphodiesterase [Actinomycetaceae bacterium]|nr:glycerophosphodiester phosphodiesterase [Actinomycetaceae bacterium]